MRNVSMQEEWRRIADLPKRYEVSNLGRIRTAAYIDARGWRRKGLIYSFVDAQIMLRGKWFAVAALVLRAFVGPPPIGSRLARHLDDDRSNNRLVNLAWGTDADNIADAIRNHGRDIFTSYGHLGHRHSEETKAKASARRKGVPTGHKMSDDHKKKIWEGYRKVFPKKAVPKPIYCGCGCRVYASPGKKFIHGHHLRVMGHNRG